MYLPNLVSINGNELASQSIINLYSYLVQWFYLYFPTAQPIPSLDGLKYSPVFLWTCLPPFAVSHSFITHHVVMNGCSSAFSSRLYMAEVFVSLWSLGLLHVLLFSISEKGAIPEASIDTSPFKLPAVNAYPFLCLCINDACSKRHSVCI